jgi:hypothetical protein
LKRSAWKPPPLLAWMQPVGNKRQQLLSVALVPLQPGHPMPLAIQVMDQQAPKLYNLVKKEMDQEPAALNDLMSRLGQIGLLPYEAQGEMDLWDRIVQIVDGNPELQLYLRIDTQEKEPREIPGARELLESMTMYQWLEALEAEVEGRL